jgi:hypothetical protein
MGAFVGQVQGGMGPRARRGFAGTALLVLLAVGLVAPLASLLRCEAGHPFHLHHAEAAAHHAEAGSAWHDDACEVVVVQGVRFGSASTAGPGPVPELDRPAPPPATPGLVAVWQPVAAWRPLLPVFRRPLLRPPIAVAPGVV